MRGADTGGAVSLRWLGLPPGWCSPPHLLRHDDVVVVVLSGRIGFAAEDHREELGVGGSAFLPRGVARRVWNPDPAEPAAALLCLTPPALEALFDDLDALSSDGEHHDAEVHKAAGSHGLVVLSEGEGPPPPGG